MMDTTLNHKHQPSTGIDPDDMSKAGYALIGIGAGLYAILKVASLVNRSKGNNILRAYPNGVAIPVNR